MTGLPLRALALLLPLTVLAACEASQEDGGSTPPDTVTQPPAPPPSPDHTITIGWDQAGDSITVSPDSLVAHRNQVIRWEAGDGSAVWAVLFRDGTPFLNGSSVFGGSASAPQADRQGPISANAPAQVYKYWVVYPDPAGGYRVQDPKIVISEETF